MTESQIKDKTSDGKAKGRAKNRHVGEKRSMGRELEV